MERWLIIFAAASRGEILASSVFEEIVFTYERFNQFAVYTPDTFYSSI